MTAFEFSCLECEKVTLICRSCWRNQKYCSSVCSVAARKKKNQIHQKRYRQSEKGIKAHRACQKRYRLISKKTKREQTTKRHIDCETTPHIQGHCFCCQRRIAMGIKLDRLVVNFISLRQTLRTQAHLKKKRAI